MSDVEIEVPTAKASMAEARPALEAALEGLFPEGLLESRWDGETLHLRGPGAAATLELEPGRFVGRARLEPPASFMRDAIVEKMTEALRRAAVGQGDV
jgi:hypothetical protein